MKNRQILLASRPQGEPTPDNFKLVEAELPAIERLIVEHLPQR